MRVFTVPFDAIAIAVIAGLRLAAAAAVLGLPSGAALGWAAIMPVVLLLAGVDLLVLARARSGAIRRARLEAEAGRGRGRLPGLDDLTGALSRRDFLDGLASAVRPGLGTPLALLIVDVDDFKALNDSFGHGAGDQVLQRLVTLARVHFPAATVGRLGGDEFAALVAGTPEEVADMAAAFLADMRRPTRIGRNQFGIGVSVGAAMAPAHAGFPDELAACADLALSESKRRGRGCATMFDEGLTTNRKNHRLIARELRAAVLLNELDVHYQRVADAAGRTVGVEALVRWNHPIRGMIPPGDFIEVAEQSTLIDMVGEWVLRRALRDSAALPHLRVAVNVSGAQLKRDGLVEMVKRALDESGCAADRLALEITETVAVTATPAVLGRLEQLRHLGLRIYLDDFGTGNAGFQTLRAFPIDCIKIDRSYIQGMLRDPLAATVVSALAAIGRIRGLPVVAEGIETAEQWRAAEAAGCTLFQGYLLGRPVPLDGAKAQLAAEVHPMRLAG